MLRERTQRWIRRVLVVCAIGFSFASATRASGGELDGPEVKTSPSMDQAVKGDGDTLTPYESFAVRKRSIDTSDLEGSFKNRIEIKFRQGSGIRLRQGKLTVETGSAKGSSSELELQEVHNVLGRTRFTVLRMHELPESTLETMKREGEKNTGQELPDLNLWYYIYVKAGSDHALADLINQLNRLDIVEYAYGSPLPSPPPGMGAEESKAVEHYWRENDQAPWPTPEDVRRNEEGTTPPPARRPGNRVTAPSSMTDDSPPPLPGNYLSFQDYREAAPTGIDMDYVAARYYNAAGLNWGYTDCEYSWNKSHEDLTDIAGSVYVNGTPHASAMAYKDHGTAVIGQLSSDSNGWGTTGLVHDSAVRLSTEWPTTGYNRPSAITSAAAQFWRGAVILLEMQTGAGFDCNGTDTSSPYVPAEWEAAVKSAVKTATANGRIVVAAAGNGNCNLDLAGFGGAFDPTNAAQDSGAIIVGAGEKNTRNKASFSTYGSRVDTQSEGDWQIYTTGYGDLFKAEGENRWYTKSFAGTSGASPIVTGASVSLSSMLWIYHGSIWAPTEIRDILRRDGTPQGGGGHIGPRPDLRKQVEALTNRHLQMQSADFDGDKKTDYAFFRPSTGYWHIRYAAGTTGSVQWGTKGDIPAPADVNGDGRAELIVFRPSNGYWYIRYWNGTTQQIQWGTNGDIPIPLDYNGDGKSELAVFRTLSGGSTGRWYIRYLSGGSVTITWGNRTDTPIARDINGDKRDDLIVFSATQGKWNIRYSGSGTTATHTHGSWGDIPLTWRDSQKRWNIAVWRPTNGTFYWKNVHANTSGSIVWGKAGDVPRFGDRNGNGWDEFIVYRPSAGRWYNSSFGEVAWGAVGDLAIAK